jgi:hypothetical protein
LAVLVDSGALVSLISDKYIKQYGIVNNTLSSPFHIKSFDGSAAVTGDVSACVDL